MLEALRVVEVDATMIYMDHLKLTTPLNIAEEKERFFASNSYEPQFVYDWDPAKLTQLATSRPDLIPLRDALVSQDAAAIVKAGGNFFDIVFRPEDLNLARQLLRHIPEKTKDGAQELAAAMATKLADLGIDYHVEIVDRHGFKCRPSTLHAFGVPADVRTP